MKMRTWHLVFGVSLILLSAEQTQAEEIPPGCSDQRVQRAFRYGMLSGENLVNQAWNNVDDCDRIEDFETILYNALDRYQLNTNASLYTVCRYTGVVTGVLAKLDVLYLSCEEVCYQEGEIAGEISAIAFCELSIAFGGLETADDFLRGPVQICGLNFEIGCDSKFIGLTTSYRNDFGDCRPYTEGGFFEVWEQARNNQCAYNPELPGTDGSANTEKGKGSQPKSAENDTDEE